MIHALKWFYTFPIRMKYTLVEIDLKLDSVSYKHVVF
jgi:hypothetical protein